STTALSKASHCTNTLAMPSSLSHERAARSGAMAMTRATISATTISANSVGRLQNCGNQRCLSVSLMSTPTVPGCAHAASIRRDAGDPLAKPPAQIGDFLGAHLMRHHVAVPFDDMAQAAQEIAREHAKHL